MAMTGRGVSGPQMNVTPLIDVLLVLIIIFMVIVTQTRTKGLEAQIPQPADSQTNQAPPPVRTVVIELQESKGGDDAPKLSINSQEVSWGELERRLHDIFKTRAEKVAFVQGEDAVEFHYVAEVIDEARAAGVERVGLMPGRERW
jgi:biopolymer transport protein TolR